MMADLKSGVNPVIESLANGCKRRTERKDTFEKQGNRKTKAVSKPENCEVQGAFEVEDVGVVESHKKPHIVLAKQKPGSSGTPKNDDEGGFQEVLFDAPTKARSF